jgi:tRNA modification GTPase
MNSTADTIAAIATPLGEGGISVLRVSGNDAISSVDKFFTGKRKLSDALTHTAHYGKFFGDKEKFIDEVVVTIFLAPNSYTGENVAEISCHGGTYVAKKILQSLLTKNIRLAEPGEFTKRAFLNGKLDLIQAEAVADLIKSHSDCSISTSLEHLKGVFSEQIFSIRKSLVDFCGLLELELDFLEEGYKFADRTLLKEKLSSTIFEVSVLLESYSIGRFLKEGVKIAIVGMPNVGKSSLLNALLMESKAIVTDIPGTTRDIVEGELTLEGISFRFYDTAGIRDTDDAIESEGIKRTFEKASSADIVLNIIDSTEKEILNNNNFWDNAFLDNIICLNVYNKIDLVTEDILNQIKSLHYKKKVEQIFVSAKKHIGLSALLEKIIDLTIHTNTDTFNRNIITNVRHKNLLACVNDELKSALSKIEKNSGTELIAFDVRNALNILCELTGEITNEEILNNIFSKFCIGK